MPTSRCACGPQVAYDYSLGAASRQFNKPRCPCTKCKNRARETGIGANKQVPNNTTGGICGQSSNGFGVCCQNSNAAHIGNPAPTGSRGLCQGCGFASNQGQGQLHMQTPGAKRDQGTGCSTQCGNGGRSSTEPTGQIINRVSADTSGMGGKGLLFTGITYGQESTIYRDSSSNNLHSAPWEVDEQSCNVRPLPGLHGDNANRLLGRDTLGRPIDFLGTGVGSTGMCTSDVICDESCGYGNGCDKGCYKRTISLPGGATNRGSGLRGSVGIDVFGNEHINFFFTVLMEILGILVFFAICTITFWITLGYYIVQLGIDLKNADRYVQTAVAIVFCLLLLAFCITLITNKHGSCCRHKAKVHKVKSKVMVKATVPKKGSSNNKCSSSKSIKSSCYKKITPKSTPTTKKAKKTCPNKSKGKSILRFKPKTLNVALLRKACKRISPKPKKSPCMTSAIKAKARYTDCQGRAIFQNSRRYAIPTEMKQPPAIVIWLRDLMCRLFRR